MRNILEENIPITGEIMQNDIHTEALEKHKNHLYNAFLNTQTIIITPICSYKNQDTEINEETEINYITYAIQHNERQDLGKSNICVESQRKKKYKSYVVGV